MLETMEFPDPVIRVAIEPKTKAGQEKMSIALAKLAEEDPTFRTWTDEETGQTIIAGMGELHLEIIVDRLAARVQGRGERRQAPGRRTRRPSRRQRRWIPEYARQTGRHADSYAHVKLTIEPNESGKGYEFVDAIRRRRDPEANTSSTAVDQGIQGAMHAGVLGGYPVVRHQGHARRQRLLTTRCDSSRNGVQDRAAAMAFKEAMAKAGPTLLEPIMKVTVTAPEEYMGDVMGDINARRGQISRARTSAIRRAA
ncbi:MAG: hypothetical protein ACLTSG_11400 [Lachnospiraceae bacterium]